MMSASDALSVIFIVFGVIVCIWVTIGFIGWLWERFMDSRHADPIRIKSAKIGMKIKRHKAAYDMLRAAEEAIESERRSVL
jgi:hypothetical protein